MKKTDGHKLIMKKMQVRIAGYVATDSSRHHYTQGSCYWPGLATDDQATSQLAMCVHVHERVSCKIEYQESIWTQRIHCPITKEIMQGIYFKLANSPKPYYNITMWAACCMAFFDQVNSQYHPIDSLTLVPS